MSTATLTQFNTAVKAINKHVNKTNNEALTDLISNFTSSIWFNYINEKSTNTTYWYDKFKNPDMFNKVLFHLCNSGWVISITEPGKNWAELNINEDQVLKYITKTDIYNTRVEYKFRKYQLPSSNTKSKDTVLTKTPVGIKNVGLIRKGSTKQSTNTFKYDISMVTKYYVVICKNLTKSMRLLPTESTKEVAYDDVAVKILDYIMYANTPNAIGNSYIDSRGRLIKNLLSKVFNPISNKDARALIVVEPKRLNKEGMNRVFLAIAELLGYKPNTLEEKAELGKLAYEDKLMLDLDLTNDNGRADAYANIWLERLYSNLDIYEPVLGNWDTPTELDQTASMLQIEGALLNHKPFLEMTNVIGNTLKDAWSFDKEGITRNQFKKAMTPLLYGSSQACSTLWTKAKLSWTVSQVNAFNTEITTGEMAVANLFKDFIIDNVKPKEEMLVKIWDEEFMIYPNRFKSVGDYTLKYDIYDSRMKSVRSIYHTHTKRVADLDQFRTYFVTLLVHNLDSQLAEFIEASTDWCLAIYDAFIVHPADAVQVEQAYCTWIKRLHSNREVILKDFFDSVGITTKSKQWADLLRVIQPLEEEFIPQASALK